MSVHMVRRYLIPAATGSADGAAACEDIELRFDRRCQTFTGLGDVL